MRNLVVGLLILAATMTIGASTAAAQDPDTGCQIVGSTHNDVTQPLVGGSSSLKIFAVTECVVDGEPRTGTLEGYGTYWNHICGVVEVWEGFMLFSGGGWHAFTIRFIGGSGELMITGKLSGFLKLISPQPDPTVPPGCATGWAFTGVATGPMF